MKECKVNLKAIKFSVDPSSFQKSCSSLQVIDNSNISCTTAKMANCKRYEWFYVIFVPSCFSNNKRNPQSSFL